MNDKPTGLVAAEPDEQYRSALPATMKMSPGLAIFFNDILYERCKQIAGHMARAEGMMPRHLIGKPEACFAIISRAIVWNLDPHMVAMSTYQTPGGSIGYMGALVQAILENSGRLEGGVSFKHEGDWSKVQGKFKKLTSPKGGMYPSPTWTEEDAAGLHVIVSAKIKGELEPRTLRVDLNEAFPLNSPLWATAPNRQICYLAVRAFANLVVPSLMYGVPFDVDPVGFYGEPMTDITPPKPPRPTKPNPFERPPIADAPKPEPEPNKGGDTKPEPPTAPETGVETGQADIRPEAPEGTRAQPQVVRQGEVIGFKVGDPAVADLSSDTKAPVVTIIQETPLARGKRLLALVTVKPDVDDLQATISDELPEEQQERWKADCAARTAEIEAVPKKGKAKK